VVAAGADLWCGHERVVLLDFMLPSAALTVGKPPIGARKVNSGTTFDLGDVMTERPRQ
jgi:hypothetical protein